MARVYVGAKREVRYPLLGIMKPGKRGIYDT